MKNMKAALGNGSKPDLTHVRKALMIYISRACEYGSDKYERANYMRPTENNTPKENFERYRSYLASDLRHTVALLDSLEAHLSGDPHLTDVEGMKAAIYCPDTDVTPGAKVGASGLPHVAHKFAGGMMALVQVVMAGLLPEDPGQPWADTKDLQTPGTRDLSPGMKTVTYTDAPQVQTRTDPSETLLGERPTAYKCQHGTGLGRFCTSCQNTVRQPVTD